MTEERREEFWPRDNSPVGRFLFEQGAVLRAAKAAFQRKVGMSQARLQTLGLLFRYGEMSQSELQRHLDVDGASVTRQVKQMEAEGLLARRPDPADNRFTLVALTPAGQERLREVARTAQAFTSQCLEGVSDEDLDCARNLMVRVRANLENL